MEGQAGGSGVKPGVGASASDPAAPITDRQVLEGLHGAEAEKVRRLQQSLSRRLGDARLIARLRELEFSGRLYEEFENELIRYATAVLCAWMHTGMIFARTGAKGYGLSPSEAELTELHEDAGLRAGLANTTIAVTLRKFRDHALAGGGWQLEGGASITTYFMGATLFEFPNEYRRHRGDAQRYARAAAAVGRALHGEADAYADPEHIVLARRRVIEMLEPLTDERTKAVVALTIDGMTQDEIALVLESLESARAVEGVMYRWRTKEQKKINGERQDGKNQSGKEGQRP